MFSLCKSMQHRLFEWYSALTMIGIGLHMFFYEEVTGFHSFRVLLKWLPATMLASFFISVGLLRIVALRVNGRWPKHGPNIRAVGSIVGIVVWSQLLYALIIAPTPTPSPGIPLFIVMCLAEAVAIHRAARDVIK